MLTLGLFAVSLLLGGMVFFAAICAPVTFQALDAPNAAKHTRAIFPRYYLFVGLCSAVGAIALAPVRPAAAALMATVAVVTAALRLGLMPHMNPWRDAELAGDAEAGRKFAAAHRASVAINAVQIGLAGLALYLLGNA